MRDVMAGRVVRLVAVVRLIEAARQGVRTRQLEADLREAGFDICRRTLVRDLQEVERAGWIVREGPGGWPGDQQDSWRMAG